MAGGRLSMRGEIAVSIRSPRSRTRVSKDRPQAFRHPSRLALSAMRTKSGITSLTPHEKKPGSSEPGLRYWPCEADTITFQEGLLSFRATGGGGQMRNANAQRDNTMIRVGALRQPPAPHVSHAESGGWR